MELEFAKKSTADFIGNERAISLEQMISIHGVKRDTSPDTKPLRKKYHFGLGDQAVELGYVYAPKT